MRGRGPRGSTQALFLFAAVGLAGAALAAGTPSITPMAVKAGDRILFGKWSGTEVKMDGEELLIMKESDIMGIIVDAGSKRKAA